MSKHALPEVNGVNFFSSPCSGKYFVWVTQMSNASDYIHSYIHIGILVTNTAGVVSAATADTAMFLMLGCLRQFTLGQNMLRQGTFMTVA